VYRFIVTAQYARFRLWPSAARELRAAVVLAPVLFARLSMHVSPVVLASDSSSSGLCVCSTVAAAAEVGALASLTSDPWVFATAPDGSTRFLPAIAPCLVSFVRERQWRVEVSAAWRRTEHINSLELRAVHTALRWALCEGSVRVLASRVMLLTDSSAVLGALLKGRSSSRTLLVRVRAVAVLLLASGVRLLPRWIPSELNPADAPSRAV
jgi:hypothetical protein